MISKTDFLIYLDSPLHLWAAKNRRIEKGMLNEYTKYLLEQGDQVEQLAVQYAKEHLLKKYKAREEHLLIQPTHQDGQFQARTDILILNPQSNKWDMYEVKSSSTVKVTHRYDITFQYLIFKEKYDIGDTYILHLNKEYVKNGRIYLPDLFLAQNVNNYVKKLEKEILLKRNEALLLSQLQQNKDIQTCIRPKTCPCLSLCHPNLPEYSIYDINNISRNENKVRELEDMKIFSIYDVPNTFNLTKKQKFQVNVAQSKKTYIDKEGIAERFNKLKYPLYFLDYETFNCAIPIFDGYKPFYHITFQYSVHIKKDKDSKLEHYEYLHTQESDPIPTLLTSLKNIVGEKGSIVVWNKGFEATRNKEMALVESQYKKFSENMNERIFDLMRIFQDQLYDDPLFKGSYSIKNVLPVLVDDLSYKDMGIKEGATAMISWYDMVFRNNKEKDIEENLLRYCELDTLAMVRIFEELEKIVK